MKNAAKGGDEGNDEDRKRRGRYQSGKHCAFCREWRRSNGKAELDGQTWDCPTAIFFARNLKLADPGLGGCAQKRPRQEAGAISVISNWLFGYCPKAVGGSALPSLNAQSFIMVIGSMV